MRVESTYDIDEMFRNGRWDVLESQLRRGLDPSDAKPIFRLANLLALRGQYAEALRLYDLCIGQRWPGPRSLNNKAVVLAWMGEARAALHALIAAGAPGNAEAACGPALFNLAVIYERLDEDGGSLPEIVRDAQAPDLPAAPAQIARHYFDAARIAFEDRTSMPQTMLDRPLFLWKHDIPTRFGFAANQVLEDTRQADELFQRAEQALEGGEWFETIRHLRAARSLQPSLAPRTVERETQALLGYCRELRAKATEAWEQGDFATARTAIEALLEQLPDLPDRSLVVSILGAAIDGHSLRLRSRREDGDLVALTAVARNMAESYELCVAQTGGTDLTPIAHLKRSCLALWDLEVNRLLDMNAFRDAEALLECRDWQWFGIPEDVTRRRWRIFSMETAQHRQVALRAQAHGDSDGARRALTEALTAAVKSGDEGLVQQCEQLLVASYPPPALPDVADLHSALADGQNAYVLTEATERLKTTPHHVELRGLRAVAIARLLDRASLAASLEQWEAATAGARFILNYEPASAAAAVLERRASQGHVAQLVAGINAAIRQHDVDRAEQMLQTAVAIDAADPRVTEMRRIVSAARGSNSPDVAEGYDAARADVQQAQRARDPIAALTPLLEMFSLRPLSAETGDAMAWAIPAALAAIARRFTMNPSPENVAVLLPSIDQVLALEPHNEEAANLRTRLLVAQRGTEAERLKRSTELLKAAEKALLELRPIEALDSVKQLELLDEPAHHADVQRCRDQALAQIRKQLQMKRRRGESDASVGALIAVLHEWNESLEIPEPAVEEDDASSASTAAAGAEDAPPAESRARGSQGVLHRVWQWFRRAAGAAILLPALAAQADAQSPSAARASEDQYWLMLVDASMSFDAIDRQVSARLGMSSYRLRHELLTLSQILLGVVAEAAPQQRNLLRIEFFGSRVRPAPQPWQAIRWTNIQPEASWRFPPDIADRSDLAGALESAASELAQLPAEAQRHLLIVSDGEMDVGATNRAPGAAFQAEERAAYTRVFAPGGPAAHLRNLGVAVHTIAIDRLAVERENTRQQQIRARLLETAESTIEEQFEALLTRMQEEAGTGPLPYSEGPYFLEALSQATAGQSRLLLPDHPLNVVWQTFFPDATFTRNVAPGSSFLVASTRVDEPVRLCLNSTQPNVTLRYDRATGMHLKEPADAPVRLQYQATSQYVIWLINAPETSCIEPATAYHGNDIELQWLPTQDAKEGSPIEIFLDLVKGSDGEPSLGRWREILNQRLQEGQLNATLTLTPPSGAPAEFPLAPEMLSNQSGILRLKARLDRLRRGVHEAKAQLVVGEGSRSWVEVAGIRMIKVDPPEPPSKLLIALAVIAVVGGGAGLYRVSRPRPLPMLPLVVYGTANSEVRSPGNPIRLRLSLGRETVDAWWEPPAGPLTAPAVVLEVEPGTGKNYRLYSCNGGGWQYRLLEPPAPGNRELAAIVPDFAPVTNEGVKIAEFSFLMGETLELKNGGHSVQVRFAMYPDSKLEGAKNG